MKQKLLAAFLAAAALALCVGASLAYFTSRDTAENVFTVGSVKIRLEEPAWDSNAQHLAVPGTVFAKDPCVRNTGSIPAYIRMHVAVSDYAALSSALPAGHGVEELFVGMDAVNWKPVSTAAVKDDTVTFSFCYGKGLAAGESTQPLFTAVQIPAFLSSEAMEAMGETFTVTVTADAIQAETFADYTEAFAAFDAQMAG